MLAIESKSTPPDDLVALLQADNAGELISAVAGMIFDADSITPEKQAQTPPISSISLSYRTLRLVFLS